ncbi:MAG: signal peptidase I [Clostridia bacterium]|nr:signal peptidase I [Clostridia bacterium]
MNEEKKENNINEEIKNEDFKNTSDQKQQPQKKSKNNPLKIISKITTIIIWIVLFIAMGVLLLTVASQKTDVFGYRLYTIMSGSMEPTIHVKDAIITQKIDEPQKGDVIAFQNQKSITVHRIIEVYTEENKPVFYKTKGDANSAEDEGFVQKSQVKGKVIFRSSAIGNTILFLQSHFIVLIIAVGVIVMIIIVRRMI